MQSHQEINDTIHYMDYSPKVEAALEAYCQNAIKQAATIDDRYAELWSEIRQYLMAGGKRMRPRLVLFAHNAYKSSDPSEDITAVAAAWELLHACLLVHDDIIDRDIIRHGKPNIAGRYQSIYSGLSSADNSHYALSAALLGGDLLLISVFDMIRAAPISDDAKQLTLLYLHKALFIVVGGQLIDTDAALYPISSTNPRSVAMHKTANYSLQAPLQCGAALAGAPAEELEKLSQVGLHAGIAYQLQDDLLGVFGDSATTGKSNRSDITEKKRTLLIHKVIENLPKAKAQRLTQLYSPNHALSSEEAEEVVTFIISSGAKQAVEEEIADEIAQALSVIDTLSMSAPNKQIFASTIAGLTTRTR